MPGTARVMTQASAISVGGQTFHPGADFSAAGGGDRAAAGDVIFGGTLGDTVNALGADDVRGKIVVMMAPAGGRGGGGGGRGGRGGGAGGRGGRGGGGGAGGGAGGRGGGGGGGRGRGRGGG